jgi:TetR/AcrR family transcriptional repressor of mexJK operon
MRTKNKRVYVRKTNVVLAAAEQAFLKAGYGGVSVDQIAELAGVSKRTIYSNFENKENLFAAVIKNRCAAVVPTGVTDELVAEDPETALIRLATTFLGAIFAPEQIALYQTVVADCRQFSEVGRIMYEGPVLRSQSVFDSYLRQQVALGRMRFPKIELAGAQLVALLKTNLHMQLLFSQPAKVTRQVILESATASVQLFLYGASTRAGSEHDLASKRGHANGKEVFRETIVHDGAPAKHRINRRRRMSVA